MDDERLDEPDDSEPEDDEDGVIDLDDVLTDEGDPDFEDRGQA